jgi:hypothetical protein
VPSFIVEKTESKIEFLVEKINITTMSSPVTWFELPSLQTKAFCSLLLNFVPHIISSFNELLHIYDFNPTEI